MSEPIVKTVKAQIKVNGLEELNEKLEKMCGLAAELKTLLEEANQIKLTATGELLEQN